MSKRILVVEDDATLNEAFRLILKKEGYEHEAVYNGQEALDALSKQHYDLILLDLLMPVMDGIEFLKNYQPGSKRPAILVFSNLDRQKDIEEVYRLGADRYVLKAWASPKEIITIINDTLKEVPARKPSA